MRIGVGDCTSSSNVGHVQLNQLTGDIYTVGEILGHTLKGIGMSLGISTYLEAVTVQYVDVRPDRKKTVLDIYHKALHPSKNDGNKPQGVVSTEKTLENIAISRVFGGQRGIRTLAQLPAN